MIVHPEVGKWLIGLGEKLFGMDPVRLARRPGGRRVPDGPGDDPVGCAGSPARRCSAASPGVLLGLRRAGVRALAAGAARHLRGLLPALRRALPGPRPRLVPPARWRDRVPEQIQGPRDWGPVRGAAASDPGCSPRASAGAWPAARKWEAVYPLAAFGVLVWRGAPGPAAPSGCSGRWPLGAGRRRPGVRPPGAGGAGRLHRHLDRLADARPASTSSTSPPPSTPTTSRAARTAARTITENNERALADQVSRSSTASPGCSRACESLAYYHRDVYVFHTHFLNGAHAHLRLPAARAGCCSTGRSASTPTSASSPAPHGCAAPLDSDLPAPGAAARHAGDLVGRRPGAALRASRCGSARATGGSGWRWSGWRRPGCRGCCTTAGRSSPSTRSSPCRSWCWR